MADFPALPSTHNPYLSGHSSAAGSIVNAMRSAAAQQQQLQEQQKAQSLKDELRFAFDAMNKGWTRELPQAQASSQQTDINAPAQPGPMRVSQTDTPVDPSRILRTPWGNWVTPDKTKPEATPQQTFSDTTGLLEKGARPVDAEGNVPQLQQIPRFDPKGNQTGYGINAAPPPGTSVTPPGSKQPYFIPGEEEKAGLKARLAREAEAQKPGTHHIDTEHFSSPVLIDPKSGKATPIQLPDGVTHNTKPDKKSTYRYEVNNDGILTRFPNEEDGTPQTWKGGKWVTSGDAVGPKKREPIDPNAPKPPTRSQLIGIESKKAAALRISTRNLQKDLQEAEGGLREVDEVWRDHYERLGDAQRAYEEQLSAATGQDIPHNDWADKRIEGIDQKPKTPKGNAGTSPTKAAAPPAKAAAAPAAAQPKTATLDHIRAYAQQKGVSEAQAVKEFKASGFSIGK